jgi:hypothetical protein
MDVSRISAPGLSPAAGLPSRAPLDRTVATLLTAAPGLPSATPFATEPQDVAAAVLFREILKPLAHGLGPVGEIALGAVADELFVRRPR